MGIGTSFNTINTGVGCTPLANFSSEKEKDFLITGAFSFDNRANYWDIKVFSPMEIVAGYIFRGVTFYEVIGYHLKAKVKKVVFMAERQCLEYDTWAIPLYALHKDDIAENEEIYLHPAPIEVSARIMRLILKGEAKFSAFEIKELIKEFFLSATQYNNFQENN